MSVIDFGGGVCNSDLGFYLLLIRSFRIVLLILLLVAFIDAVYACLRLKIRLFVVISIVQGKLFFLSVLDTNWLCFQIYIRSPDLS